MTQPKEILKRYWGYDSFRDPQEDIIASVLSQKDTIALLPTGGGKSLCYQVPGILLKGICLVISPLISLMRDQVESLNKRGVNAIALQSKLSTDEIVSLFDNLKFGNTQFLYLSPERLQSSLIIQKIQELQLNCIAVDEAHCISEWGHDFRPSYRQIKNIRQYFPKTPVIALTATATQKVIDDIRINLEMEDVQVFKKSFFRDNLAYQIFSLENKTDRLLKILNKNPHPTIIYTSSRRKTEELANYIDSKGFRTVSYHGGMSSDDKQNSFDLWMREERPIVVATNAFGMGIDKPNVRVVVHVDLPYSMENYIQEAGRGGRDGNKAFSVVLQNENDIAIFKRNTIENIPSLEEIKTVHSKLYQYFQIANGEKPETSFDFNLQEFCNRYSFNSKKVTGILHILKNHGIIDINHKFDTKSTVQFKVSSQQLINFQSKNQLTLQLIELLLRSYGTIFHQKAKISEFILAKKLKTTSTRIKKILKKLDEKEILEYKEVNANHDLFFLLPREDNHTIHRFSKSMKQYVHQQQKKAQQFIQFIRNDQVCRSQQILEYFGESFDKECGMCDVCIASKQKKQKMDVSKQLISLFSPKKELSKDEIVDQMELSEETIFIHLRNLLRRDILGLTEDNKLFLK
jgi:ATP-dependent DNA helicase RecQ